MDKVLLLLNGSPWLLIVAVILIGLIVVTAIGFVIFAYRAGREVSLFGLKIGKKEVSEKKDSQELTCVQISGFSASQFKYYPKRKLIHWEPFNCKAARRFWACGTSLISVSERGMLQQYIAKGLEDIKILLPSVDENHSSFYQLDLYDRQCDSKPVYNQLQAARESFFRLRAIVEKSRSRRLDEVVRCYSGVMYSNITIFDDDAFISFYDSTGIGENNMTLYFNRVTDESDYRATENEFLRMWNASTAFGRLRKKRRGASILFINSDNCVLMFLRDNKPGLPYPNMWDLLGGNVKSDESPWKCIEREMKEEIEYQLIEPSLFDVYDMDDRIEFTFWKREEFDIKNVKLHEGQKLQWFSENDIRNMSDTEIAFGFRRVMLEFFSVKPFMSEREYR